MLFRVPNEQIESIRKLWELPDEKIEAFLKALSNSGPQFNIFDLSTEVSRQCGLPYDLTLGIVRVLASLYATRASDVKQPVEQFVNKDVFYSLKAARAFTEDNADAQWKKLQKTLAAALSLERTLGTAAKAGPVLTEHERIFEGARILTDVRPIFHVDVSETPDAAVIIHMLKINQRDNLGHHATKYFALDSNDILVMKDLIERALEKEKSLRTIMKKAGVTVLNPGAIY